MKAWYALLASDGMAVSFDWITREVARSRNRSYTLSWSGQIWVLLDSIGVDQ